MRAVKTRVKAHTAHDANIEVAPQVRRCESALVPEGMNERSLFKTNRRFLWPGGATPVVGPIRRTARVVAHEISVSSTRCPRVKGTRPVKEPTPISEGVTLTRVLWGARFAAQLCLLQQC